MVLNEEKDIREGQCQQTPPPYFVQQFAPVAPSYDWNFKIIPYASIRYFRSHPELLNREEVIYMVESGGWSAQKANDQLHCLSEQISLDIDIPLLLDYPFKLKGVTNLEKIYHYKEMGEQTKNRILLKNIENAKVCMKFLREWGGRTM